MTEPKITIGVAVDRMLEALQAFKENDRKTILQIVCTHLGIDFGVIDKAEPKQRSSEQSSTVTEKKGENIPIKHADSGLDIKALRMHKAPNSAAQMACLVAYYLQEHAPEEERKNAITSDDIERYFKQAGYKLPKALEQLLADSKRSGYFESPRRGEYVLTRVGYNLVTHSMPSKDKA